MSDRLRLSFHGRVVNGVVVPDDNRKLPEGAEVDMEVTYPDPSDRPVVERLRTFRAWMARIEATPSKVPPGAEVDVSRESMYEGCGE